IAAVKRLAADQVQRPGDGAAVALGQDQQAVVAHGAVQDVEEGARQVGPAPFAPAGVLVEGPEGVPMPGPDLVAGQAADAAAEGLRPLAFLADRLALARGELGQEVVETAITLVQPVELLAGAG